MSNSTPHQGVTHIFTHTCRLCQLLVKWVFFDISPNPREVPKMCYADFAIGRDPLSKIECGAKLSGSAKTSAPPFHLPTREVGKVGYADFAIGRV